MKKNISITSSNISSSHTESNSNLNHVPTCRSRRSVIKGAPAFVWDNETLRTDMPYADKRYHIAHNPPPNEVNFVGGLGKSTGNQRSKARNVYNTVLIAITDLLCSVHTQLHPNRPTLLQKMYGMRNRNKIAITFTQPAKEVSSLVQRQAVTIKPISAKSVDKFVKTISSADVMPSPPSSGSGSSDSSAIIVSQQKRVSITDQPEENTIDGLPFYFGRDTITQRVRTFLNAAAAEDPKVDAIAVRDEEIFRDWAKAERKKYKDGYRGGIAESDSSESAKSDSAVSLRTHTPRARRRRRFSHKNVIKHLSGYLYGPFTKPSSPDGLMVDVNKFDVPLTMTDRAKRYYKKQKIQDNVLRRVRLSHMGFEQPPSKDESSDDNESIQNVKKLALIRTPYFVLPTIKISQVKRKDRFRNQYLKKDRLKRVNLLMGDVNSRSSVRGKMTDEEFIQQKQSVFAKFFQLTGRKAKPVLPVRNPDKRKYYDIIQSRYQETRKQFDAAEEVTKPITFAQFKDLDNDEPTSATNVPINEQPATARTAMSKSIKSRLQVSEPKKIFQRNKHERLSKEDEIDGPFYIDPNLMDKFRSPKKFEKPHKYYTNLIKGRFGIRDRLQVNGPEFNEEKVGGKDQYYHRLATEWDAFYVNELRHRPPTKKFCVKTDILMLRDIARQNYIRYYVQENLMALKANQDEEKRLMDNVEEFQNLCENQFMKWRTNAFEQVCHTKEHLAAIQSELVTLGAQKNELDERFGMLSKNIYETEQRWNGLLKLQNYYYLLQDSEWREQNDWIHRENGELQAPLAAFTMCGTRYIRPQTDCLGFSVKQFFEQNVADKLDKMKSIQPDSAMLSKSLQTLTQKTVNGLLQHNKTFWRFKQILNIFNALFAEMERFNAMEREQIEVLLQKKQFIATRALQMKTDAKRLVEAMIPKAIFSPMERRILAIADEMYKSLFPADDVQVAGEDLSAANISSMAKFQAIHEHALDVLQRLENIPLEILRISEKTSREKRQMVMEESRKAVIKQKRYDLMLRQMKNHFSSITPFKRQPVAVWRNKSEP